MLCDIDMFTLGTEADASRLREPGLGDKDLRKGPKVGTRSKKPMENRQEVEIGLEF
jgi:hypothetical protein